LVRIWGEDDWTEETSNEGNAAHDEASYRAEQGGATEPHRCEYQENCSTPKGAREDEGKPAATSRADENRE